MIRLIVSTQEFVCRVAKVRWPVSAVGQGRLNRLQVPHLTDQDDIGILPEDVSEGRGKALRIGVDLPLIDDAFLVAMEVFDRIFDRDDMALFSLLILSIMAARVVDFPGAGGPGDQDESFGFFDQFVDDRRDSQFGES